MTFNASTSPQDRSSSRNLPRETCLRLAQAGLQSGQVSFARELCLAWLAAYPGDLVFSLVYAQVLLAQGRLRQAAPVLAGLCQADPEFFPAAQLLVTVRARLAEGAKEPSDGLKTAQALVYALSGQGVSPVELPAWGRALWQARQALAQGDLLLAEASLRPALADAPSTALGAVTHLHFLKANPATPPEVRQKMAERYLQRWPDCLACMLYLADWMMDAGGVKQVSGINLLDAASQAVALLHQAAARDVAAQVAERLWGAEHPYRPMWPTCLELPLRLAIPADVAAQLGWNRLPGGERLNRQEETGDVLAGPRAKAGIGPTPSMRGEDTSVVEAVFPVESASPAPLPESSSEPAPANEEPTLALSQPPAAIGALQQELERLAERLHLPGLARQDGRYPIYVIFSVRSRLEVVYGGSTAAILETEMQRLAQALQGRKGWGARLYFPDDLASVTPLGLRPVRPGDAWGLKLSLVDLDAALAKRGEMIGALLIVGGPEIVPFHFLPNPVEDPDVQVPSDNPYASRDENYFIPEWPLGRLPGGSDGDPRLLLGALRRMTARHAECARQEKMAASDRRRWFASLARWLRSVWTRRSGAGANFGYTAAVWRRAAAAVFQPIGDPDRLHVSPPYGWTTPVTGAAGKAAGALAAGRRTLSHSLDAAAGGGKPECQAGRAPIPSGRLAYFNLHGLSGSPEWYGQRDPQLAATSAAGECDYPVALRPQDIQERLAGGGGIPQVVFSEACYGLNIQAGSPQDAIALKFLEAGSQVVTGSTCMSYGSIGAPLIAADFLGHAFWRFLKDGLPAGEALRQAKVLLADEMHRRQGYLDGEDQKTLLSFILYGDPLAQPLLPGYQGKRVGGVRRAAGLPAQLETVCVRSGSASETEPGLQPLPDEMLPSVRQVVARYLPGMQGAQVSYAQASLQHHGPVSGVAGSHPKAAGASTIRQVTLSKHLPGKLAAHLAVARLTLDTQGRLVKLVISR